MKKFFTTVCIFMLYMCWVDAQSLIEYSSGYSSPLDIQNCGDKRLFIVQRDGKIFVTDSVGNKRPDPYLDISDRVYNLSGEQGLLGLAFDPSYKRNGFFYVYYINKSKNSQISRFRVKLRNRNLADTGSEKFLLEIPQPFSNHNGGCIRFGPDGYLYIGTGDGGSGGDPNNNAQNPNSLLGKMLRLDVHSGNDPYRIPPDNPFVNTAGYRPEIWALGLRNPWRWSFDAKRGDLWIADVGQYLWEEVDVLPAQLKGGQNLGWRCYEGNHAYNTAGCSPKSQFIPPVTEYYHGSSGDCSIIGGFVYRGQLYPRMIGKYFYADYCSGYIRALFLNSSYEREVQVVYKGDQYAYVGFGEDVNNELYVANYVNGKIYRLADVPAVAAENNNDVTPAEAIITISPNPTSGNFTLGYKSEKADRINLRIFNSMGTLIYTESKQASEGWNKWAMNINNPRGFYNIEVINSSGKMITEKLIKN